jgi:protein-S-isoprenylcysteine O-methyltransferase Ste14
MPSVVVAAIVGTAVVVAARTFDADRDVAAFAQACRAALAAAWWSMVPALCRLALDDDARAVALVAGALGLVVALQARTERAARLLASVCVAAGLVLAVVVAVVVGVAVPDRAQVVDPLVDSIVDSVVDSVVDRVVDSVVVGACVGGAAWLAWAMRSGRRDRLRFALHLASMLGWCAVVAPLVASSMTMPRFWPAGVASAFEPAALLWQPSTMTSAVAACCVVVGAVVVAAASAALARHGGTPDPADPPRGLCTSGPYARLRHPLYVGEILVVLGSVVVLGTSGALAWGCTFVVVVVAFARAEDRALAARHSEAWRRWRGEVPAWLPRLRRRRVPALDDASAGEELAQRRC